MLLFATALCSLVVVLGDQDVGQFLHVTDTHTDIRFVPGSPQHCTEDDLGSGLGCCHASNHPSKTKPNSPCSEWGSYNCDSSPKWTQEVLKWMSSNIPGGIDFVINTGDFASHHDITQTPWENEGAITKVTQFMADAFPGIPQLNVIGNHDGWPVDNTVPYIEELMLMNISKAWTPHLDKTAGETIAKGGYYSHLIAPGLRFISLNILWFDNQNLINREKSKDPHWDPKGTWAWLNATLANARADNELVWFGHHFGPEAGEASEGYSVRLTQFFDDYQDIIRHTFCGHSHENEFFIYHTYDKRPVQFCWAPGSLYPANHNPMFNIYKFNRTTFQILDFDHYECDLNKTIAQNSPHCEKTYSFTEAYGESDFSLASVGRVYEKLVSNATLLQHYHEHHAPGDNFDNHEGPNDPCTGACVTNLLNNIPQFVDKPFVWSESLATEDVQVEAPQVDLRSTPNALTPSF